MISINIPLAFASSQSGYLYIGRGHFGKIATLFYNHESDEYVFKLGDKSQKFNRFQYKKLFRNVLRDIPKSDHEEFESEVTKHANIQKYSKQAPEEVLSDGLKAVDRALSIVAAEKILCPNEDGEFGKVDFSDPIQVSMVTSLSDSDSKALNHQLIEASLADEGFFSMGRITGIELNLNSKNDNPLHGLIGPSGLGLTNYGEGIEGDDYGNTLSGDLSAKLNFEKGHIALRRTSKLYSKRAPQQREYSFGGRNLKSTWIEHRDENGRYYVEQLNIDGTELEIRHEPGFKDTYVKVIARREVLNDKGGVAQNIQEKWHSLKKGGVLYNNVDHMDKKTRWNAEFEVGKKVTIYEKDFFLVDSEVGIGGQISTDREDQFVSATGSVRAVFFDKTKSGKKFPSYQVELGVSGKQYSDIEKTTGYKTGITIKKEFSITDHNFISVEGCLEYGKDQYSKKYSSSEQRRNGREDFQHCLNIGYRYQF